MSMILEFTRVTPEELDQAIADPEWAEEYLQDEGLPGGHLEKA